MTNRFKGRSIERIASELLQLAGYDDDRELVQMVLDHQRNFPPRATYHSAPEQLAVAVAEVTGCGYQHMSVVCEDLDYEEMREILSTMAKTDGRGTLPAQRIRFLQEQNRELEDRIQLLEKQLRSIESHFDCSVEDLVRGKVRVR